MLYYARSNNQITPLLDLWPDRAREEHRVGKKVLFFIASSSVLKSIQINQYEKVLMDESEAGALSGLFLCYNHRIPPGYNVSDTQ